MVLTALVATGCGEDKEYGDPIELEFADQSATSAVTNASGVTNMEGDAPVSALNVLSGNLSVLVNAKYQHLHGDPQTAQRIESPERNVIDETCLTQTETELAYDGCETQGMTVDGTVSVSGDEVEIHLDMSVTQADQDFSSEIAIDGVLEVTASAIDGYLDFDTTTETEDLHATVDMDSDFDVELEDGCAVGGEVEVHAVAVSKSGGVRAEQDLWVKAEYGPACGDVAVY